MRSRRYHCATLLLASTACWHPALTGSGSSGDMLLPQSARLQPPSLNTGTARWDVFVRRAADSVERRYASVTRSEHALAAGTDSVLLTVEWSPPADTRDSLVIRRRGLQPLREVLYFGGVSRRYAYQGGHVSGTTQHRDSTARPFDTTFAQHVFAFNEVEVLVRSVSYRTGLRVVVPLFSEVDQAIEQDTISVASHDDASDTWTIRFADPAIVSDYTVRGASRDIIDVKTRQRRSGTVFHYVRCDSCAVPGLPTKSPSH